MNKFLILVSRGVQSVTPTIEVKALWGVTYSK